MKILVWDFQSMYIWYLSSCLKISDSFQARKRAYVLIQSLLTLLCPICASTYIIDWFCCACFRISARNWHTPKRANGKKWRQLPAAIMGLVTVLRAVQLPTIVDRFEVVVVGRPMMAGRSSIQSDNGVCLVKPSFWKSWKSLEFLFTFEFTQQLIWWSMVQWGGATWC